MKTNIKILQFVWCLFAVSAYGQDAKLLKSTINAVGSNVGITNSAGIPIKAYSSFDTYRIYQSIGQTGNIGAVKTTTATDSVHVQQGFLNNKLFLRINNSNNGYFDESLELNVFPNPFIDLINIKLSKTTNYDIEVFIYDINGKRYFYEKFDPTDQVTLDATSLKGNLYILRVKSGGNQFNQKLLKNL